jgi:hypothetical protein
MVEETGPKIVTVILSLGFVCGATWISIRWWRQRHTMRTTARLVQRSGSGRIGLSVAGERLSNRAMAAISAKTATQLVKAISGHHEQYRTNDA